MSGKEMSNMAGNGPQARIVDNNGPTRGVANDPIGADAARNSDKLNKSKALEARDSNNLDQASQYLSQIVDPNVRIETYIELYGSMGDQSAPSDLFQEGSGGISKPDSLFFMMIFYMEKSTANFKWSDVLNSADIRSTSHFVQGMVNDNFLPLRDKSKGNINPVVTQAERAVQIRNALNKSSGEIREAKEKAKNPTNTTGGGQGVNNIVKWPFQNLPMISGGLNKSVDWKGSAQTTTFAEPIISVNGGASAVDLTMEFVYCVGIPGIGDHIPTESPPDSDQGNSANASSTSKYAYWTVEDLMGVCYLAQSLVLPWESSKIVGSKGEVAQQGAPYFPVLFLRHHSLFPYLAPFVVVSVKIEPDEGQPLLVTRKNRAHNTDLDSLDYSAIRQTVKITLNLRSANYFTTVFQGEEVGQEIQKLTSGKTYRQLAGALLGGRI